MLRRDVVEAVEQGKFHVYAVGTVNEGIEVLTGVPAGERDGEGRYPPSSVNGRVEKQLREYSERARRLSVRDGRKKNEEEEEKE